VIGNWQLSIADLQVSDQSQIGNRKSTIDNGKTHPLPRGGTDLMNPHVVNMAAFKLHPHHAQNRLTVISALSIFVLIKNKIKLCAHRIEL